MRTLSIVVCLILAGLTSCKDEDDPAFTSAEGKWTYTTPDSKIKIDFEITKNSSGVVNQINGVTLNVDGTAVVPVTITDGVNLPAIASMRFSANDAKLVYPYAITFTQATVSADFTAIAVASAEYTFPWGTTQNLSSITIKRP